MVDFSPAFVWLAGKPQGDLGLIQTVWGWWCDGGGGFQSFQVPATQERTPWFEFLVIFDLFLHHGHMAKSHCMSRHAARECSRSRAKKMATEPDETIKLLPDVVEGKAFPFLSMTYFWNVSCLVVGVGWGKLTLVWYVELTSQTADEEVIFFLSLSRLFKHKVDRKTWDDSHVSPLPKAKNIMPQLRTTSLATLTGRGCSKMCRKSFVWQWQSTSYPDRFRCPPNAVAVKELCFLEPQATGTTRVREVESNATLTKNAIVHLFVWEQLLSKAKSCLSVEPSRTAIAIDIVGPPSPLSLVTDFFWRRLGLFSCLPTLIVNENRFLWTQAFGQAQKERRIWRKKRCSVLISSLDPVLSLSIFCLSPFACKRFLKGLGTKRAYSTAKRFAKLNYAGRLVSLSACARWKSLRRLLNEPPQVWIFAISCPICTWSLQAREAEGRNSREPWVDGCVLSFLFWSTDKDARSWFLGAHSGKTYQKSFWSSFFSLPIQRDRRKIAWYLMYDVASFRHMYRRSKNASCVKIVLKKSNKRLVKCATEKARLYGVSTQSCTQNGRLRKFNRTCKIEFNFFTTLNISMKLGPIVHDVLGYKIWPQFFKFCP